MLEYCNSGMKAAAFALTLALFIGFAAPSALAETPRIIHIFVALADNQHQGIVPVPAALGNGDDPGRNLYWGSGGGVKTFFARSKEWELIATEKYPRAAVLERCVFKHRTSNTYLVADAYQGAQIRQAITEFLDAASGALPLKVGLRSQNLVIDAGGDSHLVAYIGHDGLMDFELPRLPQQRNYKHRDAILLACASKQYFSSALRAAGATPLLWTTNLMAPEAYTLKAALDGWIANESAEQIRQRAAEAYAKYQKCSVKAARGLLVTGW